MVVLASSFDRRCWL